MAGMRLNPDSVALLKRMDPAEILLWLALNGQHYIPERAFATKEEMLAAERRVMLAAGHKARLAAGRPTFTKGEVDDSRRWLKDNGFSALVSGRG